VEKFSAFKIERDNIGAAQPLYIALIPSTLAMSLTAATKFGEEDREYCILVFTTSKGYPINVPITPALIPPRVSLKTNAAAADDLGDWRVLLVVDMSK